MPGVKSMRKLFEPDTQERTTSSASSYQTAPASPSPPSPPSLPSSQTNGIAKSEPTIGEQVAAIARARATEKSSNETLSTYGSSSRENSSTPLSSIESLERKYGTWPRERSPRQGVLDFVDGEQEAWRNEKHSSPVDVGGEQYTTLSQMNSIAARDRPKVSRSASASTPTRPELPIRRSTPATCPSRIPSIASSTSPSVLFSFDEPLQANPLPLEFNLLDHSDPFSLIPTITDPTPSTAAAVTTSNGITKSSTSFHASVPDTHDHSTTPVISALDTPFAHQSIQDDPTPDTTSPSPPLRPPTPTTPSSHNNTFFRRQPHTTPSRRRRQNKKVVSGPDLEFKAWSLTVEGTLRRTFRPGERDVLIEDAEKITERLLKSVLEDRRKRVREVKAEGEGRGSVMDGKRRVEEGKLEEGKGKGKGKEKKMERVWWKIGDGEQGVSDGKKEGNDERFDGNGDGKDGKEWFTIGRKTATGLQRAPRVTKFSARPTQHDNHHRHQQRHVPHHRSVRSHFSSRRRQRVVSGTQDALLRNTGPIVSPWQNKHVTPSLGVSTHPSSTSDAPHQHSRSHSQYHSRSSSWYRNPSPPSSHPPLRTTSPTDAITAPIPIPLPDITLSTLKTSPTLDSTASTPQIATTFNLNTSESLLPAHTNPPNPILTTNPTNQPYLSTPPNPLLPQVTWRATHHYPYKIGEVRHVDGREYTFIPPPSRASASASSTRSQGTLAQTVMQKDTSMIGARENRHAHGRCGQCDWCISRTDLGVEAQFDCESGTRDVTQPKTRKLHKTKKTYKKGILGRKRAIEEEIATTEHTRNQEQQRGDGFWKTLRRRVCGDKRKNSERSLGEEGGEEGARQVLGRCEKYIYA